MRDTATLRPFCSHGDITGVGGATCWLAVERVVVATDTVVGGVPYATPQVIYGGAHSGRDILAVGNAGGVKFRDATTGDSSEQSGRLRITHTNDTSCCTQRWIG